MLKVKLLHQLMNKTLLSLLIICSSGCSVDPDIEKDSSPAYVPVDVMAVKDAIPKHEKRTRAGNPAKYTVLGKQYTVLADSKGYQATGVASWYGTKFHGRKTSNGEIYDMYAMTAAHKTLPIPSYVRVTNLKNKRSVVVRVNDRGPFHDNRIIDLSYTAAVKLDIQKTGTGFVKVTALEMQKPLSKQVVDTTSTSSQSQTIIYLQLGAFSHLPNAQQLQQKLTTGKINDSRVLHVQRQGKMLYKVQVGPLHSVAQADSASQKLASLGYIDTQLIVEKK